MGSFILFALLEFTVKMKTRRIRYSIKINLADLKIYPSSHAHTSNYFHLFQQALLVHFSLS